MKNGSMSVLIVDDSLLFREGLVNMFASQPDFTVVGEAGSVQEAVSKARQVRPDIILMDFGLPDGSGADATQSIIAELPATRIVILTIDDADERLMEAIRSGVKGFLLKEMPFSKLLAALRALMRDEAAISRRLTMRLLDEISRTHMRQKTADSDLVDLSRRELEILRELAGEASNQEIAERLSLSVPTVKHYVHKVLVQLNVKNRKEAARLARREGLGTFSDQPRTH
jgi:two-component system nitrate/nitrite response regulator NarL